MSFFKISAYLGGVTKRRNFWWEGMHAWSLCIHITILLCFIMTIALTHINNKCQYKISLFLWCWELIRILHMLGRPILPDRGSCGAGRPWNPYVVEMTMNSLSLDPLPSSISLCPRNEGKDCNKTWTVSEVAEFQALCQATLLSFIGLQRINQDWCPWVLHGRRHLSPAEALPLLPLDLTCALIKFHQAAPGLCLAHTWLITSSSASPLLPTPGWWCLSHSFASASSSSYILVRKPDTCAMPSIPLSSTSSKDDLSAFSLISTTENSCCLSLTTHNLFALSSSSPEKRLIRGWDTVVRTS